MPYTTMRKSEFVNSRVLVCAPSTHEVAQTVDGLEALSLQCLPHVWGAEPFALPDAVDAVVVVQPQGVAAASAAIKQIRSEFSMLQMPILVLNASAPEPTADWLLHANDFMLGAWTMADLQLRVTKLLQVRQQFLAASALNVKLHSDLHERSAKLHMLIENGLLMAATHDVSALFRHALWEGKRLLHCDACSLYLVTPHKTLRFAMRTLTDTLPSNEIPLYDPATGEPNTHYISVYVALRGKSVLIDDVYQERAFDVSGTKAFDQATHYKAVSMLTVPMAARGGPVSGVFQFINRIDPETGAIGPFPSSAVSLVEALAAQAAVTYENLQLLDERKQFMERLIHTIATAIDAKSPHTGRHSARVPELALMLAQAAHDTTQGPLANFRFANEDAWHEFRVGAWLHDCGKITTPEHVMDKATKLQTVYNRIHEIRTRFEVLLRDAEIARLRAIAAGADPQDADRAFAQRSQQLQDDFAFVAQCNLGAESMEDADVARIQQIAQTPWLRHFDDRLGLGHEEHVRRSRCAADPLPCTETLLADADYHRLERGPEDLPPPEFGFQVDMPAYLYDHGEIHNLTVRKGTLTPEERYKINEHMIHGIVMLERMPFPEALKRVPEYAGTHHETLLGSGYPRRLEASQLSIPTRIMAIADIFEALTAADRPYKAPKKFSEALDILYSLKQQGHIDPDLFDLFLTSGVYQQFADQFLLPEQMDGVEIARYLG